MYLWVIVLLFHVTVSYIPYKRPCTDLSPECLKRCLQAAVPSLLDGVPEYGLETLDPYHIEKLDLTLPGGILIKFTDGLARGLRKCVVDFGRFKVDTLEVQYHCNLTIKGKYKSTGRMLMFPIDGEGDSTIRCNNLRIHSVLKLKSKIESDGLKYLEIKRANTTHSYDGRVSYSMTNLFRKNPEISLDRAYTFAPLGVETLGPWGAEAHRVFKKLSERLVEATRDPRAGEYLAQRISIAIQRGNAASVLGTLPTDKAMLDFMNGNWRMIAEEFGNPMVDYGVACVMRNLRRLLKIIPMNQIILEPVDL